MVQKLREFLRERATLDSKVFFIVLIVGGLTTLASAIFTFVEDLGIGATISTFCCFLLLSFLDIRCLNGLLPDIHKSFFL